MKASRIVHRWETNNAKVGDTFLGYNLDIGKSPEIWGKFAKNGMKLLAIWNLIEEILEKSNLSRKISLSPAISDK